MTMVQLSSPLERMRPHYTVVVIGSGYGGAIAASRLARAGQRVCVLERGKEFQAGDFPETPAEVARETQVTTPVGRVGDPSGLYDYRLNQEVDVILGTGLGGGSLVNAGVAFEPDGRVFDDPVWPQVLRDDRAKGLAKGFERAKAMLAPRPLPANAPRLPKKDALESLAAGTGAAYTTPPLTISFEAGLSPAGVPQGACQNCGNCGQGCNYNAKNALTVNYLPDAVDHGAEIYTRLDVRRVQRVGGKWLVHFVPLALERQAFDARPMWVSADMVVLAAGSLGSTEILLRSAEGGLALSSCLGSRFSVNGGGLSFFRHLDREVAGIGQSKAVVGPCVTGTLDMREGVGLDEGFVISDGIPPSFTAPMFPLLYGGGTALAVSGWLASLPGEVRTDALQATQSFLLSGHDSAAGRMQLEGDRLQIRWPGVGDEPVYGRADAFLRGALAGAKGHYFEHPLWNKAKTGRAGTVHPLGGCPMAEDASTGVVNHRGQVFVGEGAETHPGLYVLDGAVVPRSLGANPLLTIAALAERGVALAAEERGWTIDFEGRARSLKVTAATTVGVAFTETMKGQMGDRPVSFTVTVSIPDLRRLLDDPGYEGRLLGTVDAPFLSDAPLVVTNGTFRMFGAVDGAPGALRMTYVMRLRAADGREFVFDGHKRLSPGASLADGWRETTTLYATLWEAAQPVAEGILRISPEDFAKQMTTMRVLNARDRLEELDALARFSNHFGGTVFKHYTANDASGKVEHRKLRLPEPEIHMVNQLRLTRYFGGTKGPLVMTHGATSATSTFTVPTIDTNLAEFFVAAGYDVWLYDSRMSCELPLQFTPFTVDDVAADFQPVIDRVRALSGAEGVQVFAHCFGAVGLMMALLDGLKGVRSALCSQAGFYLELPVQKRLQAGLGLPSMLKAAGVRSLGVHTGGLGTWLDHAINQGLLLVQHQEPCKSEVCQRLFFYYGGVCNHDRLNEATHALLPTLFGESHMTTFEHITRIGGGGRVVDAQGRNRYLPGIGRLKMPIGLAYSAKSRVFLPGGVDRTYKALCDAHGPERYAKLVLPGYGHQDALIGEHAARDVFPRFLAELERQDRLVMAGVAAEIG